VSDEFLTWAVLYAQHGLPVFPIPERTKLPYKGSHGFLDAVRDVGMITRWWSRPDRANDNIGIAIPPGLIVVDTDPRHGGHVTLDRLEDEHGEMPETLTALSGRGDGGTHRWYHSGLVGVSTLGPGVDLKCGGSGYVVAPPSVHPDSGQPYGWDEWPFPVADLPGWVAATIAKAAITRPPESPRRPRVGGGESPAEAFSRLVSWAEILEPVGFVFMYEHDGTGYWRHPAATSPPGTPSATTDHGAPVLVMWSESAGSMTGLPCGAGRRLTRFRTWAVLNHHGDEAEAARAIRRIARGVSR
jgi:hypothetical protein